MSRGVRVRRAAAAALGAAAIAAVAAPAQAASRTVTLDGWWPRAMAFSDRALVWTEAAPVRVDPRRIPGSPPGATAFTYYRAEGFRAALDRAGRRFTGLPETLISIRTSIAAMRPGVVAPYPGGLLIAPWSPRFPAPVVACCSPDGEEVDVDTAGGAGALPAAAAAWDGGAVRWVQLQPDGTQVLRREGDPAPLGTSGPTREGLVAIAADHRAWVEPATPTTLRIRDDGLLDAPVRSVALPGTATGVLASPGLTAVTVRAGRRVAVVRVDDDATAARRVWSGTRIPRVAVGGGSVALADGRAVWAARGGVASRVTTARRQVDAVAIDGRRLAWAERATRRGTRVAVVRLASLR